MGYEPEKSFEFRSGPDKMVAELRRFSPGCVVESKRGEPYISFHGKGPRGGYVNGPGTIPQEAFRQLDDMIADALGIRYRCHGCGREESDCSADPCEAVQKDRES